MACAARLYSDPDLVRQISTDQEDSDRETNLAVARRMHEEGVPFFSKETLAYLAEVFDEWRAGGSRPAVVTDLLGRTFEIPNQLGQTDMLHPGAEKGSLYYCEPGKVIYRYEPVVNYFDYHDMTRMLGPHQPWEVDDYRLYMSMAVAYTADLRDASAPAPPEGKHIYCGPKYPIPNTNTQGGAASQLKLDIPPAGVSDMWKTIVDILKVRDLAGIIRKIIIFGGHSTRPFTYTKSNPGDDDRYDCRGANQHALVMHLADFIKEQQAGLGPGAGTGIQLFAQDPFYDSKDMHTLQHGLRVNVLPDPRAFLEVDDASIVINISGPGRNVIMEISRPAVMVFDTALDPAVQDSDDP